MRTATPLGRARRRHGFTLTEVLVSVPILVLIFWVIGQIFTTVRETVSLAMVHAKTTTEAESAVQRLSRDLVGLRSDGRLVIINYRTQNRPMMPDDPPSRWLPGVYGHLAFVSQLSASNASGSSASTATAPTQVTRVLYRPVERRDTASQHLLLWRSMLVVREVLHYNYDVDPAAAVDIGQPSRPRWAASDRLLVPARRFRLPTGEVVQARADLLAEAVESFRRPNYPDSAVPREENYQPPLGWPYSAAGSVFPLRWDWCPAMYPDPWWSGGGTTAWLGQFYHDLWLSRCALVYNGPMGAPGTLLPETDNRTPDPGAAAFFQWYGWDAGTNGPPAWFPGMSRVAQLPGQFPSTSGQFPFYVRRFMRIRSLDDAEEFDCRGAMAPLLSVQGGNNPNRSPDGPLGEPRTVPWPRAIRVNFHLFDRVGRFRNGAFFQAVFDLPGLGA